MDVKEFVSHMLTQIVEGVHESANRIHQLGGAVCFEARGVYGGESVNKLAHVQVARTDSDEAIFGFFEYVEFDLAVTVSEQSEKGAGGGLRIWAVNVGGEAKSASSSSTVSRVKFRVPIALPVVERADEG